MTRITLDVLNEKIDDMRRDLTEIKIQTQKTNGRVNGCEAKISALEAINCNNSDWKKWIPQLVSVGIAAIALIIAIK